MGTDGAGWDGIIKKISRKTAVELALGLVLLLSLVCFYAYSREARISYAKGRDNTEGQSVHFRLTEEDWAIADMTGYYSALSYIPAARFALQQCGKVGDTVYCAAQSGLIDLTYVPLGIQVTAVAVLDTLPDRYMETAEQQFSNADRAGGRNWNGAVYDCENPAETFTQQQMEALTQYMIVELALYNPTDIDMILTNNALCLTAVDAQGSDRRPAGNIYSSYSAMGRCVLLEADRPVDYVGLGMNAEGQQMHYRQPVRALAQMGNSFYVEEEMHIKLLYIVTNEELAEDGLALCSLKERGGEGQPYSNAGYAIRLQEETAYDAQND